MTMQPFNPLTIPLRGQRLIEASAGTGKTFSIALLFLRLILEQKLDVDQILVVTFTRSATEELRERIRSRVREALDVLEMAGTGEISCEDGLLADLLQEIPDRVEAMQRLTDTMARMDESAIYTIHGFCQRMLQDHAFESGAPFAVELVESEQEMRREIIRDFWRQNFYAASLEEALWATKNWGSPDKLAQLLDPLVAKAGISFIPDVSGTTLGQHREALEQCWQKILRCWEKDEETISSILANDPCLKRRKGEYKQGEGLEEIIAWMRETAAQRSVPWHLPREGKLLAASLMAGKLIGKKIPPEHELFALFDEFINLLRLAAILVIQSAYQFLGEELESRKQQRAQMHFTDLLTRLAGALESPGGDRLVQRVRERFAVALVDEFQDTDTPQYAIFRNLFGQEPQPGLFMIGDPKQAIYSFRGADVFAYILAKHETAAAHSYTMDSNYRSTSAMVHAVNRLFDQKGSFVFERDIPFSPVKSAGKADTSPLLVEGVAPRPLLAMLLDVETHAAPGQNSIAKDNASEGAARWTAGKIAHLLRLGGMRQALIGDKEIVGGDIAVLVRTHREAGMVQRELSRLRIASVYYSQDSVFSSEEAWEVHRVLLALLDLSDVSLVKSALSTGFFGKDAHFMERLHADTSDWDDVTATLEDYRHCWRSQGVSPMLQRIMADQQVVQRMVDSVGGERKLTNYLHLAELLQEVSELQPGLDSLVRWLNMQRHDPEKANASQQLRLESDENLVRIVTIHKAKGLEYPVVFLPFAWNSRTVKKDDIFFFHMPGTSDQVADLGSGEKEYYELAEHERLAEDLRLLYVALTRSRYCCYFTWGRISSMEKSALARLLHGRKTEGQVLFKDLTEERIAEDLACLEQEGLLEYVPAHEDRLRQLSQAEPGTGKLAVRTFRGHIDTAWNISSYSQMVRGTAHVSKSGEVEIGQPDAGSEGIGRNIYTFPKGAAAGTCLHAIFERLDFSNYSNEELRTVAEEELQKNGLDLQWSPLVCEWIADVLACPLPPNGILRLDSLAEDERLVEMEFYFSMHSLDIPEFNRILSTFGFSPIDLPALELKGLMRGFIDLVFCHQGRYFLADYKSNYLGAAAADYLPDKLEHAMREHRYDLQYLIYTVALHRYLRTRVSGYEYSVHFGGVHYLYLRGMHPNHASGNGVYHTVPDWELIEKLDRCFGSLENP